MQFDTAVTYTKHFPRGDVIGYLIIKIIEEILINRSQFHSTSDLSENNCFTYVYTKYRVILG